MQGESPSERVHLALDPEQLLQRLPDLTVHLQSDGSVRCEAGGRDLLWGPHALRVLDLFARPTTFKDAMKTLQPHVRGAQDWIDLSDTIRNFHRAGLLEPAGGTARKPAMRTGFDAPAQHISMLNDRERTEAYIRAIREVVRPDDVVVEIGTGTGVLAVAAAKAGAQRVYAIEAGDIGEAAEAVFRANGLSDRITLVRGMSTQLTLPERADVLVSEIIGDEPLHERVLEATRDAIKRFLKPGARFIPGILRIFAVPVQLPESVLAKYRFTESRMAAWGEWYGVDFGRLGDRNPPKPFRVFVRPHRARDWTRLSEPARLTEIDFASGHPPRVHSETEVVVSRAGVLNGLVAYFDVGLSAHHDLSVDPERVDELCHWRIPVEVLPHPMDVHAGDRLKLTYEYGGDGQQGRVSVSGPLGGPPGAE